MYCRGNPRGRPGPAYHVLIPPYIVRATLAPSRSPWPLCYHEHITILFDAQKKGGHSFLPLFRNGGGTHCAGICMAGTVCLTFDFDALSLWISRRQTSPASLSRGEFGAVAVPRILQLLTTYGIQSTWFIPGHTCTGYVRRVTHNEIADTVG